MHVTLFFFLWDWLVFTRSRPALVFFVIIAHCPHLNRFHWSGSMISKADCFIFYWLLELASSFVWQSNQCTLLQATSVCHSPPPPQPTVSRKSEKGYNITVQCKAWLSTPTWSTGDLFVWWKDIPVFLSRGWCIRSFYCSAVKCTEVGKKL